MTTTVSEAKADIERPSADELYARAEELVPLLQERARDTEETRHVPEENLLALEEAGLMKMVSPPSFGGYGYGPHEFAQVVRIIAKGCASTAWVYGFLVAHNPTLIRNAPFLVDKEKGIARSGASAGVQGNPAITAKPVDGGWIMNGTWKFVSGISNSDYVLLMALQDNGDEDPGLIGVIADVADGEIEDVWHFAGMKGTGSNTFHMKEAFVPKDREWGVWGINEDLHPAVEDSRMNVSIVRTLDMVLTGVAVGSAEKGLEEFHDRILTRMIGFGQGPQREHREAWARYSEAAMQVKTSRLLWDDLVRLVVEMEQQGRGNTTEEGAEGRLATSKMCTIARDALLTIADGSGSTVLHLDSPLQRQIRDVITLKSHATLHWDHASVTSGSALLGLAETIDPLIVG